MYVYISQYNVLQIRLSVLLKHLICSGLSGEWQHQICYQICVIYNLHKYIDKTANFLWLCLLLFVLGGTYYEEKEDLMSVLMLDEKISPQVMNNSCVSCKCSHRINISGSENSAASDHDPLQQAHPLETTTAHVLPPCGGSTVEELLVLAFECLLKKARNT